MNSQNVVELLFPLASIFLDLLISIFRCSKVVEKEVKPLDVENVEKKSCSIDG